MKKIALLLFAVISLLGYSQQTGSRYNVVPEGGGYYQVPNKEILTPAYSATVTVTTTHEETICNFDTLTGAATVNAVVTYAYPNDKLYCEFYASGSSRVVTFGNNFTANGTLTVSASAHATVFFMFNGSKWQEVSRQSAPSMTTSVISTDTIKAATSGGPVVAGSVIVQKGTSTTFTASATLTPAQILKGVAVVSSGTVTLTVPTASDMGTAIGAGAGTVVEFSVVNAASGGTCTVAVNTGVTASGFPGTNTLTLANSATVGIARFRLHFISATAATLTRIN